MAIVVSKRSNEAVFICKSLGSLGPVLVVDSSVHCPSTPPSSLFLDHRHLFLYLDGSGPCVCCSTQTVGLQYLVPPAGGLS